jgi:Tfp pilus assembly protein PilP
MVKYFGITLLVFSFLFLSLTCQKKEKPPAAKQQLPVVRKEVKEEVKEVKKEEVEKKYVYKASHLRDPFISLIEKKKPEVKLEDLVLVGFLWDKKGKVALLESQKTKEGFVVTKGTRLGNGRVIYIGKDSVVLEQLHQGVRRKYVIKLRKKEE